MLKAALKQRRLRCGVAVEQVVANKSRRILEAWVPGSDLGEWQF